MRGPIATVATLLVLLHTGSLAAQTDSMTEDERLQEAIRLSELGRLHYDGGDFAEAAEAFTRAWDLHPDPVLGYNAARSYENAGEPERAIELYQATLELEPDDDALRQRCRDAITRIENLLMRVEIERASQPATLRIISQPPQAFVLVDGESYGQAPVEHELSPGAYTVRVELDGYAPYYEEVDLEPGQVLSLRINLVAATPIEYEVAGGGPNWWAVGLVGGGSVVALGLGVLAALGAQDKYDEAQLPEVRRDTESFNSRVQEGRELRNASTFFYAIGIAGAVTAVVLYFVTDSSPDTTERSFPDTARLDLFVGPNGAEAGFRMVWKATRSAVGRPQSSIPKW